MKIKVFNSLLILKNIKQKKNFLRRLVFARLIFTDFAGFGISPKIFLGKFCLILLSPKINPREIFGEDFLHGFSFKKDNLRARSLVVSNFS